MIIMVHNIIVKGIIAVANNAFQGADRNDEDKKVIFKNGTQFRKQISRINITQADGAHSIHHMSHYI